MAEKINEPEDEQYSRDGIHYFKYKREHIGPCNICGKRLRLYPDHVPPAACDNREAVEVISMFPALAGNHDTAPKTFIQNGVKYRTLCRPCNNNIGLKYDPALIGLTRFVSRTIRSSLILPQKIQIRTRPGAIYRSILGHLMAARIDTIGSVFDDEVRECVLDGNCPVPEKYHFHYWIYPYRHIIHMRDVMTVEMTKPATRENMTFGQILKFYPLAFWVVDNNSITSPARLGSFNNVPPWKEREFLINLSDVRPADFPEAPHDFRVTFLGSAGSKTAYATRRHKRQLL